MYIDSHTHSSTSDADISVLNCYPNANLSNVNHSRLLSCGIHPWHIESSKIQHNLERIEQLCQQQKIAAIGECGLDTNTADIDMQKRVFKQQIALSEQYGLPLIIHSVKTHHHILALKKQLRPRQRWIIHGFHGAVQTAEQLTGKDIFISFGKNLLTHPDKLKKILSQIDLSFVLLETDDEPIGIKKIYAQAAKLLDIELDVLKKKIEVNFKRVFG
ncbi:TatD DNase family protein [Saccharicrinis carchari]|uniref:TatD DNase family protein n=1 Tax=Saccharicrinis carchari TaxID=1168039 RepID=A0A521CHK5_SACCC|nr:TatD family hydrolase [Saccharicrinis carchari]SMO58835.1 TatD DNase family protein [Saccharicrinis carchari]